MPYWGGEESSTSFTTHWGILDDFVPNWGNLEKSRGSLI